jgi:uncharacterized membrane protein
MDCELLVVTFPRVEDALKVHRALRVMREPHALGLQYSATVSKDSAGHAEAQFPGVLPINLLDRNLWLLCQFANALYCPESGMAERLVEAGLDRLFVDGVRATLVAGSSSLIVYNPPEDSTDLSRLVTILSLFKSQAYRTSFSEKVRQAVLAPEENKGETHVRT